MKRAIVATLAAVVIAAAIGSAQQAPSTQQATLEAVVIEGLQDGTYLLKVASGVATVNPVPVIRPGDQPTPPPTPDDLSPGAKAICDAAKLVQGDPNRPETAGQLAELYRQLGAKITETKISGPEMITLAVKYGTQTLMAGRGSTTAAAWRPVLEILDSQLMQAAQDGASDAEFSKLLVDAGDGLDASAPQQPQLDLAKIMAIIKMVLEILALFS